MSALFDTWNAGHTLRWHANSCHALQRSGDTVSAHSGRMAVLAVQLWPADAALIAGCLVHDLPEAYVGDVPGPVKRDNPDLYAALTAAEGRIADQYGWQCADMPRLSFLDRFDAYLWMLHIAPEQARNRDWSQCRDWLLKRASDLGIRALVDPMIGWVAI